MSIIFIINSILKSPYFQNFTPAVEKVENEELRYSFYEKNFLEIPKNMKIENPKQIEMRKSIYKFGDSYTSMYKKQKEQNK